jgi:hypothetical protein
MRRTSLSGHALRSEGKPYERGEEEAWVRVGRSWHGVALCECGETSSVLDSDSRRKRWHVAHKDEVRGAFDGAPGHG